MEEFLDIYFQIKNMKEGETMREKIKRLLSLLLALSMLIGTVLTDSGFGVTVYAAPPTDQQPEATKNVQVSLTNLTKVGNVSFGNVTGTECTHL